MPPRRDRKGDLWGDGGREGADLARSGRSGGAFPFLDVALCGEWNAERTGLAERTPPSPALILPRLGVDVPRSLYLAGESGGRSLGGIALALFEAGILQEEDWAGNERSLLDTVNWGLERWINAQGAKEFNYFTTLALVWTDNIEEEEFVLSRTQVSFPTKGQGAVGLGFIREEEYSAVLLEPFVNRLEWRKVGLGWAWLHLFYEALTLIYGENPNMAQDHWWEWTNEEDPLYPLSEKICNPVANLDLLEEMRTRVRGYERQVIDLTFEAMGHLSLETWDDGYRLGVDPPATYYVRWSEGDPMQDFFDAQYYARWESEGPSDLVYIALFDSAGIVNAFERVGQMVSLLHPLDALLTLLKQGPPKRKVREKGKSLREVFA